MSMLLTSAGLMNDKLKGLFIELAPEPVEQLKVAFVITASLGELGDKAWLVKDLNSLYMAGVAEVDIIDISHPKKEWLPRLEWADIIWVEGGTTKFLMHHVEKSDLKDELAKLLETRLYIGVSAGSMILGECLPADAEAKIYKGDNLAEPYKSVHAYLGWLPVHIVPHYRSPYFDTRDDEALQALANLTDYPVYALDDDSAILVEDGDIKRVISDGAWKIFLRQS